MSPAPAGRRGGWLWLGLAMLAAALAAGGWLAWRYAAPVEVRLAATVDEALPFEVEMLPPVVRARPGEMVSVVYRIRNTEILPLEAYGAITIEPAGAAEQIEVFLSQCGGLNTFESSRAENYQVLFRVQPAGLSGARVITLRHTFDKASPR
jgi:cytochrome c oxidase assembly protein Cox11